MARRNNRTRKRQPRKRRKGNKSRKGNKARSWRNAAPNQRERTVMLKKCGRKCFLGPKKSFPICTKGTCKINRKGVHAAFVRGRQWGKPRRTYKGKTRPTHKRSVYSRIVRKAKKLLRL